MIHIQNWRSETSVFFWTELRRGVDVDVDVARQVEFDTSRVLSPFPVIIKLRCQSGYDKPKHHIPDH